MLRLSYTPKCTSCGIEGPTVIKETNQGEMLPGFYLPDGWTWVTDRVRIIDGMLRADGGGPRCPDCPK